MDLNDFLNIGMNHVKEYVVKPENTADYIGNTGVKMLSTPTMIGFMEHTATCIIDEKIPENYRPVGTKINIEHVNPTPVNMKVTVKATLTAIEGRKLVYNVEAFNEECRIGFGIYEQHVINLKKFLDKYSK